MGGFSTEIGGFKTPNPSANVHIRHKIINDILNSPKNVFYSALQNKNEVTESTEVYQEKYNNILNKIEKFFLEALTNRQKFDTSEEDDDNNYA